jgi:hypothetical protein
LSPQASDGGDIDFQALKLSFKGKFDELAARGKEKGAMVINRAGMGDPHTPPPPTSNPSPFVSSSPGFFINRRTLVQLAHSLTRYTCTDFVLVALFATVIEHYCHILFHIVQASRPARTTLRRSLWSAWRR